jgi:hypothetical protein
MDTDRPPQVTWAALLGRWTEFARASVALPRNAEGDRWRRAVPAIIGLQAVTYGLGEMDRLAPDERALGLDRAAVLIDRHAAELCALWGAAPARHELAELIADSRSALRVAAGEAERA